MLTIELPKEFENKLELLSLSTGRTMQFYAREAILEYLDDVEARYLSMGRIAAESAYDLNKISDNSLNI